MSTKKLMVVHFLTILLWICTSCLDQEEFSQENEEYNVLRQAWIWFPQLWDDICKFANCNPSTRSFLSNGNSGRVSNILGRASIYGRAVASTGEGCTASLISDRFMVTARHCTLSGGLSYNAEFNMYGTTRMFDNSKDEQYVRYRLNHVLGLEQCSENSDPPSNLLTNDWMCVYESTSYTSAEGYRDIHYYRCLPKIICGALVYPGHLYGHIKTGPSQQSNFHDGFGTYMMSINRRVLVPHALNIDSVLMSPTGIVNDAQDGCNTTYNNCLETYNMDTVCGSSGAPVFHYHLPVAHDLLAIHRGSAYYWPYVFSGTDAECNTEIQSAYISGYGKYFSNLHSYITNLAARYKSREYLIADYITNSSSIILTSRGGNGGTPRFASCSDIERDSTGKSKFVAIGIIGTTNISGFVGNFGLICAPWDNTWRIQQIDQAKVIWGGSQGVPPPTVDTRGLVIPVDFNT